MVKTAKLYRNDVFVRDLRENEDYVLQDGESIRVPSYFMDSASKFTDARDAMFDQWQQGRISLDEMTRQWKRHAALEDAKMKSKQATQRVTRGSVSYPASHAAALDAGRAATLQAALPPQQYRPGFVQTGDADRQRRMQAYDKADKVLTEAWKNPPAMDPTLTTDNAKPNDARLDVYDRYTQRLENAWKTA